MTNVEKSKDIVLTGHDSDAEFCPGFGDLDFEGFTSLVSKFEEDNKDIYDSYFSDIKVIDIYSDRLQKVSGDENPWKDGEDKSVESVFWQDIISEGSLFVDIDSLFISKEMKELVKKSIIDAMASITSLGRQYKGIEKYDKLRKDLFYNLMFALYDIYKFTKVKSNQAQFYSSEKRNVWTESDEKKDFLNQYLDKNNLYIVQSSIENNFSTIIQDIRNNCTTSDLQPDFVSNFKSVDDFLVYLYGFDSIHDYWKNINDMNKKWDELFTVQNRFFSEVAEEIKMLEREGAQESSKINLAKEIYEVIEKMSKRILENYGISIFYEDESVGNFSSFGGLDETFRCMESIYYIEISLLILSNEHSKAYLSSEIPTEDSKSKSLLINIRSLSSLNIDGLSDNVIKVSSGLSSRSVYETLDQSFIELNKERSQSELWNVNLYNSVKDEYKAMSYVYSLKGIGIECSNYYGLNHVIGNQSQNIKNTIEKLSKDKNNQKILSQYPIILSPFQNGVRKVGNSFCIYLDLARTDEDYFEKYLLKGLDILKKKDFYDKLMIDAIVGIRKVQNKKELVKLWKKFDLKAKSEHSGISVVGGFGKKGIYFNEFGIDSVNLYSDVRDYLMARYDFVKAEYQKKYDSF